jgi:hypothetical protein
VSPYCPIPFAAHERQAAELAWRYLAGQIAEAQKITGATKSAISNLSHPSRQLEIVAHIEFYEAAFT